MNAISDAPARASTAGAARLAVVLAFAVILGLVAELAGYLPTPWDYLSQLIYPWLAGAFIAGAAMQRLPHSAAAGAVFIVTGLVANTAFKWLNYGHTAVRPMLEQEWLAWLTLSLVLGVAFGCAGWARALGNGLTASAGAAVLLASGLAEVGADVTGILPWGPQVASVVLVLVAVSAVLLLRALSIRQKVAVVVDVAVLVVAAMLLLPLLVSLVAIA